MIILVALASLLNLFPQIQDSSVVIAVGILSSAIEIIGLIRDRSAKGELPPISNQIDLSSGPHTNVNGDQENLFSGSFDGPTSAKGGAVDMRESTGSINVAEGPVNQHFGDNITQIIKPPEKQLIPRIQPPPQNFVGRVDDINEILTGFERGSVIAGLRGMGGVGKTALALKLAEKLASRYPDGQILVEMKGTAKEPLSWAESMIQIIHAYDPGYKMPPNEGELRGKYFSILHGKKALLFLDNAASREQVEPLLPPPESALLLTSRYKFALPGLLNEMDLDPGLLPQEDAEMLLLNICGRIGEHAGELAKLCGCLPIALRNAAYALKEKPNLSPDGYIERLGDAKKRLELVDATFSTSYELLAPELQRLWSLLSVFPADFNLSGAEAVWEMKKIPAEDALGELVKWSLLDFLPSSKGEGSRYKLHDLARDFAGSCLDDAAREPARLRHARHYQKLLWLAQRLFLQDSDSMLKGLTLFDVNWMNIQAGQMWASENKSKSDKIAEICSNFARAGSVLSLRLHPSEYINWLEVALVAARGIKRYDLEAYFLSNLGVAYFYLGQYAKAIEYHEHVLKISRASRDRRGEGVQLGNLGGAYSHLGETRKSIKYHEQSLKIAREIGDRRLEGSQLGNLGNAYSHLGEMQKAIECHKQALKISGSKEKGNSLLSLGNIFFELGDKQKAIEYYEMALNISRKIGDRRCEGSSLGGLGNAFSFLGETRKAIENYEQWLEISRKIGDRSGEGGALGDLGLAYSHLGEFRKAIEYYEHALKISREIGDRLGEGSDIFNMSISLQGIGQQEEAVSLARSALEIFEEIESPHAEAVRQKLAEWSS